MKLLSATIRNYRTHRDLRVEFDPRLTLVSGPNESGKSTLVEALHRALFLRAKAGGEVRERMRSDWGDPPEVVLTLEVGGRRVELVKSFRGTGAKCSLAIEGEGALAGDAAEERLAQLLKSGEAVGGRGADSALAGRWAHLWVWQGESGTSPAETLGEQQDRLVQRLQAEGGAAVTQSALDARVIRTLREWRDALWTRQGAKVGTEWSRATAAAEASHQVWREKQQRVEDLEAAAARHDAATRELAEKREALLVNQAGLAESRARRQRADLLERELEPLRREQQSLEAALAALNKVARDLAEARAARDDAQTRMHPHAAERERRMEAQEAARRELLQAETRLEQARHAREAARLWQGALTDHLQALDQQRQLALLQANQAVIAEKRAALHAVRQARARTPSVLPRDLDALRKLEASVASREAALEALGARIELVSADQPVAVDGQALAAGASRLITHDAELVIGAAVTLRIRPGGHTGITDARQAADAARRSLAGALTKFGVASVADAHAASTAQTVHAESCRGLEAELERLDAAGNEAALLEHASAHAEARRRAQRAAAQAGRALPEMVDATREARRESDEACRLAGLADDEARAAHRAAQAKSERAALACVAATQEVDAARAVIREAEVRILTLEQQHGSDAERANRQLEARRRQDQCLAQQGVVQAQLDPLQPAQLDADINRLEKALGRLEEAMTMAGTARAVAQSMLQRSGTSDPRADAAEALARYEEAAARARELQTRAEAIRFLAQAAEEVQRATAQRFVEPLAEKASVYLECLYGPGARVLLDWDAEQQGFVGLRVDRSRRGAGTYAFAALSGGAREQVGMAMRLAMAEVLAAEHDGCLPVVLDDAFANSDPERVRLLQRMLYRAAERGLQLLVLTCTPADYGALGAKEIRLERPPAPPPAPLISDAVEPTACRQEAQGPSSLP